MTSSSRCWPDALATAFPLRSLTAFTKASTTTPANCKDSREEYITTLRSHGHSPSRDAVLQILDRVWFGHGGEVCRDRPIPLAVYYRRTADLLLRADAAGARLHPTKPVSHHHEALLQWRWTSIAMSPDLLLAFAQSQGQHPRAMVLPNGRVDLRTPALQRLLERGISQNHLHSTAGRSFEGLWESLMRHPRLGDIDLPKTEAGVLPASPFPDAKELHRLVIAASITRAVLLFWLAQHERNREIEGQLWNGLLGFWRKEKTEKEQESEEQCRYHYTGDLSQLHYLEDILHCFLQGSGCEAATPYFCSAVLRSLEDHGLAAISDPNRRARFERDTGIGLPPSACDCCLCCDLHKGPRGPVSPTVALPRWHHRWHSDTALYADAIEVLPKSECDKGKCPKKFEQLFWQYVRLKTMVRSILVEPPGVTGLNEFQHYYDRIKPFIPRTSTTGRKVKGNFDPILTADLESQGAKLTSLELRPGLPDAGERKVRDWNKALKLAQEHHPDTEFGIVLSLFKRGAKLTEKEELENPVRYSRDRWKHGINVNAFCDDLRRNPDIRRFIVGFDVAAGERDQPNWLFLPYLRQLRQAAIDAARCLAAGEPFETPLPRSRLTVHAGEDFESPFEGLRRIDEFREFGLLGPGDRIGHGIALGRDPNGKRHFHQRREERLFDLVWERELYVCGHVSPQRDRISLLEHRIRELTRDIFHPSECKGAEQQPIKRDICTVQNAVRLWRELHDERLPTWLNLAEQQHNISRSPDPEAHHDHDLLNAYLTDPETRRRGAFAECHSFDEADREAVLAIQHWMRTQLGCLEVIVEANPSSNLVITGLGDLKDHPMFRLSPFNGDAQKLGVCINDDNPIIFATNLADEYAYTYAALLNAGVTSENALTWLERARQTGVNGRFTNPPRRDP